MKVTLAVECYAKSKPKQKVNDIHFYVLQLKISFCDSPLSSVGSQHFLFNLLHESEALQECYLRGPLEDLFKDYCTPWNYLPFYKIRKKMF